MKIICRSAGNKRWRRLMTLAAIMAIRHKRQTGGDALVKNASNWFQQHFNKVWTFSKHCKPYRTNKTTCAISFSVARPLVWLIDIHSQTLVSRFERCYLLPNAQFTGQMAATERKPEQIKWPSPRYYYWPFLGGTGGTRYGCKLQLQLHHAGHVDRLWRNMPSTDAKLPAVQWWGIDFYFISFCLFFICVANGIQFLSDTELRGQFDTSGWVSATVCYSCLFV